ncbi:MAG: hypothetical protein ABJE66_05020 [Deltaproteobacteria bacterium]
MSESAETALLGEVVRSPGDDAPRLVWADARGGERGELVALQCELARGVRPVAEAGAIRRRQRELVDQYGHGWSGLDGLAKRCRFRRGFVELATFSAARFCDHADAIFAAAPLLASIELEDVTDLWVQRVLEHPAFGQVRGFALGVGANADDALVAGAGNGAFSKLATLRLGDLRPRTAQELIVSRQLRHLERLVVSGSDEHLQAVFATTTRLRALDLWFQRKPDRLVPSLPPTLTELVISASALDVLAATPLASRLERLVLTDVRGADVLPVLGAFTSLRSLDVHTRTATVLEAVGFAAAALPQSLRELRCNRISPETARVVAEQYGAQLELLEINGLDVEVADTLQPLVAGELFANPLVPSWFPMFAGELPHAPGWDYPFVRFSPARS